MKKIRSSITDKNPLMPTINVLMGRNVYDDSFITKQRCAFTSDVKVSDELFKAYSFTYSEIRTLFEIMGKLEFNKDFVQLNRVDESMPLLIDKKLIAPMRPDLHWYWINPYFIFKGRLEEFIEDTYPENFSRKFDRKLANYEAKVMISSIKPEK